MAIFTLQELKSMITVSMGDYKTAKGDAKLVTKDLGSCVGIAMWDSKADIGGLLHIMLPHHVSPDSVAGTFNPAKYADTGLDEMVGALVRQGALRSRLQVKICGAAHMLKMDNVPESEDISSRNLAAVEKKLSELKIPIIASDVGGYRPRTMVFEPGSGSLMVVLGGKTCKLM